LLKTSSARQLNLRHLLVSCFGLCLANHEGMNDERANRERTNTPDE